MNKLYLSVLILFSAFAINAQNNKVSHDSLSVPEADDAIPTITLSSADEESDVSQNVSSLLTTSRDPFVSAAAYNFSAARFRIRGYEGENTITYMNGIPVNDLDDERVDWNNWGGLNDVVHWPQSTIGLSPTAYSFGDIGGATSYDTRATEQRKQLRVSYALTNRTYQHRVMATWSSGVLRNGWAVSLSASRRWADEGYVPGTNYDSYAYFASVDKKINEKHRLNITFFGAPTRKGRSAGAVQEMYDLSGSNYYNPNWGYQEGKKRNAREDDIHQPMAILRHDWEINDHSSLSTALSYQFGKNGNTAMDWYDASDPRPDYYTKLPSSSDDLEQKQALTDLLQTDENARQINWNAMYQVNYGSLQTIHNANGIQGNDVTGLRSKYIIEERRTDSKEANFYTNYQNNISKHLTLHGGLGYQYYKGHNFKLLNDLLGGEFFVDIDKYAERDFPDNATILQNDLQHPNRILKVGDHYGYDYDANIRKGTGWLQGVFTFSKLDFFLAADASTTTFWRNGYYQNGRFPDNSLGESEKHSFFNYGAKGGVTYKIDGRNYLYLNGAYLTKAPLFRNAYVSPRTRDNVAPGLSSETIYSGEGGYQLRAPYFKARATGYYTQVQNHTETVSYYDDSQQAFVNLTQTGIDNLYMGVEVAIEAKPLPGLTATAAANIGDYVYTSRPTATITQDNNSTVLDTRTVYAKNFYVSGTPQNAYTVGVRYQGKQFWSLGVNFNYFDKNWLDFNPARRTVAGVSYDTYGVDRVVKGSQLWKDILYQQELPAAYTLDANASKSFKFGKYYLYFNLGVNNILNNQFLSGGFEQLRFDYADKNVNKFPPKYFYAYGTNFFASVSLRL